MKGNGMAALVSELIVCPKDQGLKYGNVKINFGKIITLSVSL
jgi:hypothetical protein